MEGASFGMLSSSVNEHGDNLPVILVHMNDIICSRNFVRAQPYGICDLENRNKENNEYRNVTSILATSLSCKLPG